MRNRFRSSEEPWGGPAAQVTIEAEAGEMDRFVLLHMLIDEPQRMKGRKVFVAANGDLNSGGKPRLEAIRDQYTRAPEPKRLVALGGSAHAQVIFYSDQGKQLRDDLLRFLSEP